MKLRQTASVVLFLLSAVLSFAQTGITAYRLGDNTGEDWEPAILADGSYLYLLWPHFLPTSYKDSTGATCMPYSTIRWGKEQHHRLVYVFQSSSDGGTNTQGLFNIGAASGVNYLTIERFTIQNYKVSTASKVPLGVLIVGSGTGINVLNNTVKNIQTTAGKGGNAYGIGVFGISATPLSVNVLAP